MSRELVSALRWVGGGLLIALGLWIIAVNWVIFWRGFVRRARTGSWTPLLGALLCAGGMTVLPVSGLGPWMLAPFVMDWGSLPGISHAIYWLVTRRDHSA